jgi:hypothetical protein
MYFLLLFRKKTTACMIEFFTGPLRFGQLALLAVDKLVLETVTASFDLLIRYSLGFK